MLLLIYFNVGFTEVVPTMQRKGKGHASPSSTSPSPHPPQRTFSDLVQLAVVQVLIVDEGDAGGQLHALGGTEGSGVRPRGPLGGAGQPAWSGGTEQSADEKKPIGARSSDLSPPLHAAAVLESRQLNTSYRSAPTSVS